MKKYIAPELKEIKIEKTDIIQTSSEVVSLPKINQGAKELSAKEIDVFE